MIGKIARRSLVFLCLAATLCFVHDWIFSADFQRPTPDSVFADYAFIALACFFVIAVSLTAYYIQKKYAIHAYLGASLLKMLAALYFISQLRTDTPAVCPDFFNFTLAYLLLLFAELWVVLGLFKNPMNPRSSKNCV